MAVAWLGGTVFLTGCGYQLRGSTTLPEQLSTVYVNAANSTVGDELRLVLADSGARIASRRKDADATLWVGPEQFAERVLSVDADTGKAREFELAYNLAFNVRTRDGRVLLATQNLNLLRDYVFDKDAVIGKSREKAVLQLEMRRDAVLQILRRVRVALVR